MSAPDFTQILDEVPLGEIEKPKPLPEGAYRAIIKKIDYGKSAEKKTPYVRFHLEIVEAINVDENELESYGAVNGKKTKVDFYVTENTKHNLKDFLINHLGIEADGQSFLSQIIPEAQNRELGINIKHEISERSQEAYSTVSGTFNPDE